MAESVPVMALSQRTSWKWSAGAAIAALGVVYGDIGTSTLYGLKQAVDASGEMTVDSVLGVVSVIIWSLILIVALK